MASYQKQSSGNWKAIIRRKGYKSQSKTFLSQDEAIEWAETLEQALTGAPSISRSKAAKQTVRGATQLAQYVDEFSAHIPMSTVIEEYLESVQNRLKRPKNEASFWRQLGPYLAKTNIERSNPTQIRQDQRQAPQDLLNDNSSQGYALHIEGLYILSEEASHKH